MTEQNASVNRTRYPSNAIRTTRVRNKSRFIGTCSQFEHRYCCLSLLFHQMVNILTDTKNNNIIKIPKSQNQFSFAAE